MQNLFAFSGIQEGKIIIDNLILDFIVIYKVPSIGSENDSSNHGI
jgi:hypothetical protein